MKESDYGKLYPWVQS